MKEPWDDLTPATAKMVFVEWDDFTMVENWNTDEDVDHCSLKSVGWIMEDNDIRAVVARTYDYDNQKWAEFLVLPKTPPTITPIEMATKEVSEVAKKKPPRKVGGKG